MVSRTICPERVHGAEFGCAPLVLETDHHSPANVIVLQDITTPDCGGIDPGLLSVYVILVLSNSPPDLVNFISFHLIPFCSVVLFHYCIDDFYHD